MVLRFDWRGLLDRAIRQWRGSLQLRTVALTLVLSALAVTVVGGYIVTSVQANLFDQNQRQVVAEAGRAAVAAQKVFTTAEESGGTDDLEQVKSDATKAVQNITSTTPLIGILRAPGQTGQAPLIDSVSEGFSPQTMVSSDLRATVDASEQDVASWQSIAIPNDTAVDPGIIVGTLLHLPQGEQYELYIVYNLRPVQDTLDFVQGSLLLAGVALVLLIGAVAYLVVRLVVGPVRVAAEASEKLAAGELESRLPEDGDDELSTLARSFNRMADSLQSQIGQLADLSRVQQRFVSDVSHELRTPLTTIRMAGEMLYDQRKGFPAATARTAELLHTQTQRFESLLADLLEMSRYDAGAVQLELEPTNLVRLAEDAIETVEPLSREKHTEIRLIAPGGYFEADVDARRVRRVLVNLLGNAIDHGDAKPIDVYVDSDEDAVAIAVRDHGIGMVDAEMQHVFDRFWRADPSRQRSTGGTGLGLAISLEDATVHGGALEVWSEPSQGSCFRLTLPRRRGDELTGSPLGLPPEENP
ncbi:MAG: MtrAB system histidine kinase MtrB [Pseudolysinimonas sp.]|uniref:MtrAB system histidine kinase MtrB n=1 Tax=Pseudolysinimonas sp. TaxID=2680009 RepID=UPI003266F57E